MTRIGSVDGWAPCTLDVQYSPLEDVLRIEGIRYDGNLFRGFGCRGFDIGTTITLVSREDGLVMFEVKPGLPSVISPAVASFDEAFQQAVDEAAEAKRMADALAEAQRAKRRNDEFWDRVKRDAEKSLAEEEFRAAVDAEISRLRGRTIWQRIAEALPFTKKRKS